ncbi:hypothetical protein [Azospirillum soli]|uniref:hypothetical protein n=1 Tax=Azospirillum soli TaxID=1304799 RepID=UPI001AE5975C|nr:hypothetical protein [Azospirillum soli]MBP2311905.1 hypothetical protein [Azospirillum soli]
MTDDASVTPFPGRSRKPIRRPSPVEVIHGAVDELYALANRMRSADGDEVRRLTNPAGRGAGRAGRAFGRDRRMSLCALPQSDQIRLQRIAEHLSTLGPRAVCEALAEALAYGDLDRLEAYRILSPGMLAVTGGDAFPPRAMVVPPADLHDDNDDQQHGLMDGREVA